MESTEYYSKRDSSKGSKPVTADAGGTEWRVGEPIGRPGAYGSFEPKETKEATILTEARRSAGTDYQTERKRGKGAQPVDLRALIPGQLAYFIPSI